MFVYVKWNSSEHCLLASGLAMKACHASPLPIVVQGVTLVGIQANPTRTRVSKPCRCCHWSPKRLTHQRPHRLRGNFPQRKFVNAVPFRVG
jgi:hypothetical protein